MCGGGNKRSQADIDAEAKAAADARIAAEDAKREEIEAKAEKKREEAVKYDPSLTEKAMQPAKRGRGRPKGTTKEAIAAKSETTTTSEAVSSEA